MVGLTIGKNDVDVVPRVCVRFLLIGLCCWCVSPSLFLSVGVLFPISTICWCVVCAVSIQTQHNDSILICDFKTYQYFVVKRNMYRTHVSPLWCRWWRRAMMGWVVMREQCTLTWCHRTPSYASAYEFVIYFRLRIGDLHPSLPVCCEYVCPDSGI